MGDPSAVINQMLRYPENRQYAEHLVEYLVEDDTWGARRGQLYLVTNEFSTSTDKSGALSPRLLADRLRDVGRSMVQLRMPEFVAWVLGLAVCLIIGREAWRRMAQRTEAYRPRFAMPVPMVSQPGEAGRAAVLSAPTTPRSLVFLELMTAVSAYLAGYLDIGEDSGMASVFDAALDHKILNQTQRDELKVLQSLVGRVQAALASGGQSRVRPQELRRAHLLMLDITRTIEHRQRP